MTLKHAETTTLRETTTECVRRGCHADVE